MEVPLKGVLEGSGVSILQGLLKEVTSKEP